MVGTPCFHCRGHRFNPGQGTKIPHALWTKKKKKENRQKENTETKSCSFENIHKITLIINNSVPIQANWLWIKYLNIFKEQCFRKSRISINWSTCHLKKLQWLLPWKITISQIYGYFCLFFLWENFLYHSSNNFIIVLKNLIISDLLTKFGS